MHWTKIVVVLVEYSCRCRRHKTSVVLDDYCTGVSADDSGSRVLSETRASSGEFQDAVAKRLLHRGAWHSRVAGGIRLPPSVLYCVEFGDDCNSVTNTSRRSSFGIRCHRRHPAGGLLGAAVCKNEWPPLLKGRLSHRVSKRKIDCPRYFHVLIVAVSSHRLFRAG